MLRLILLLLPTMLTAEQLNIPEGSPCQLHTGNIGVCKKSQYCEWLIRNFQRGIMEFSDIRRCTFDNGDDIVCCGDEQTDPPLPDKTCNRDFIFVKDDCISISAIIPESSPIIETKFDSNISKVHAACMKYANLPTFTHSVVYNGRPALQSEFSHVVALGYPNKNDYDFDCGGSLIADQWVVTAAHCITDGHRPTIIRMGNVYLYKNDSAVEPMDRPIERIIRHPNYKYLLKKNDIALIEFRGLVTFSTELRPACITTNTDDIPAAYWLVIAGWGSIEPARTNRSEVLQVGYVNSVPLNLCNRTLTEYNRLARQSALRALSESQMCALNLQERTDACQGDSGGPIFLYDNNNISTVVGIISFGISCGTALPSVYTRIASYIDWIESYVWP